MPCLCGDARPVGGSLWRGGRESGSTYCGARRDLHHRGNRSEDSSEAEEREVHSRRATQRETRRIPGANSDSCRPQRRLSTVGSCVRSLEKLVNGLAESRDFSLNPRIRFVAELQECNCFPCWRTRRSV